jgi:polygalacturonase
MKIKTAAISLALFVAGFAHAQDTRHVTEPKIPAVCRTLTAQLTTPIAEADESKLDTERIQQAIDSCTPGTAVELRAQRTQNAFLTGPLELKTGITLLVAGGATLFASRDPRLYDLEPGSCGKVDTRGHGCKPLIHVQAHDVAIMGDGVIDGRGGAKLLGQNVTWWDLAEQARTPSNARQNNFRIVVAEQADNFILYRVTIRNSPNFQVIVSKTNGFTAWGVKVWAPGKGARNTDGIDPSGSTNVTITNCWISTGDDNVAIKAGSTGPSTHMTIAHNHFFRGHGMSIGSETNAGASDIEVSDLTIDGADNGIRIKSKATRGGLVQNVAYRDVCIRNVKNPIVMETTYENQTSGNLIPRFEKILLQNVRVQGGGKVSFDGFDAAHPLQFVLDGVEIAQLPPVKLHAQHARLTTGPGQVNFVIAGDDVKIDRMAGDHKVPSCDGRFPAPPAGAPPDAGGDKPRAAAASGTKKTLTVAAQGPADFRSVQEAVYALPDGGGTINIKPGTYREVVHVTKPNVRLIGDAADPTRVVIVYDKAAGTSGGTLNSATVDVRGDDFFARGITFQNDFWVKNPNPAEVLPTGGAQAIALAISADRAVLRKVRILSGQDTLYLSSKSCAGEQGPCVPARQYLADCYVEGHVDFIFGDAKAYFSDCEIHGLARSNVMYTAQSKHYADEDSGYVFDHCKLTADPGAKRIILGRPWRPYSTVVFLNTDIQAPLEPAGWSEWHPGETHSLDTSYYAEFQSSGPGANPAARDPHSKQLTAQEAEKWRPKQFLYRPDHWDPTKIK